MSARRERFLLVTAGLGALCLGAWLILSAFRENLVFFYTPTQVQAGAAPQGRAFRLGGMVEKGSLRRATESASASFVVTDLARSVRVSYRGILPDLFKEGKGVVSQGRIGADGVFVADEVLAKHDENYMPPEAAFALGEAAKATR
ncbi:MAG TPA: cytochrome c maturation protein CcmE [Telluria sp.]|jgi:cytochrome c-type biogenesis protein CcmE